MLELLNCVFALALYLPIFLSRDEFRDSLAFGFSRMEFWELLWGLLRFSR